MQQPPHDNSPDTSGAPGGAGDPVVGDDHLEGRVGAWLGALPRYDAPPLVRARVLGAEGGTSAETGVASTAPTSTGAGRRLALRPRIGLAAAALLVAIGGGLLAFQAGVFSGGGGPGADGVAAEAPGPVADVIERGPLAGVSASRLAGVVSMQGGAMLHSLETFDHVGQDPHELYENWGR